MRGLILSTTLESYEDTQELAKLARFIHRDLGAFSLQSEAFNTRLLLGHIDFTQLPLVASSLHVFEPYLETATMSTFTSTLRTNINHFTIELRKFLSYSSPELQRSLPQIFNDLWHFAVLESVVALNELETPIKLSFVDYMRARDDRAEKNKQLNLMKSTLLKAHAILLKATIDRSSEARLEAALAKIETTLDELEVIFLLQECER